MTIYCWGAPRDLALPEPEERLFQVTSDTQVLAHIYWQADRAAHPNRSPAPWGRSQSY